MLGFLRRIFGKKSEDVKSQNNEMELKKSGEEREVVTPVTVPTTPIQIVNNNVDPVKEEDVEIIFSPQKEKKNFPENFGDVEVKQVINEPVANEQVANEQVEVDNDRNSNESDGLLFQMDDVSSPNSSTRSNDDAKKILVQDNLSNVK